MTLHNLQKDFIEYVKTGEVSDLLEGEIEADAISTGDKMDIYKDNVFANATNALKINYPYLQKLVGEDFFSGVSKKYVENKLPETGALSEYGSCFGQFLGTLNNVSGYEFIPDFAKIEWAIHEVEEIEKEECISPQELAEKLQNNIPVEIAIIGAAKTLASEYNLKYIYDLLDSDDANEVDHDKLNCESKYLIRKSDDGVKTFLLNNNEFWLLNLIENGKTFQASIEMINSEEEASTIVARLLNFKIIKEIK